MEMLAAIEKEDEAKERELQQQLQTLKVEQNQIRDDVKELIVKNDPVAETRDTDYVFMRFVMDHLPKGMKFDKNQVKRLYDFYLKFSELLFKKMKPGGYFLTFSSPRLYHAVAMSCDIAGFEVRDMINWTYTQSMPKGMSVSHIIDKMDISNEEKKKLKEKYKNFKTPQIKSCFEPICVAMKPIGKLTFIKNELKYDTGLLNFSEKVGIDNDHVPANIITTEEFNEIYDKNFLIQKESKSEKGKNNTHLTVKPVKLLEHLIKIFSKEESLVVDPFVGSGTTLIACKNSNRKCIGMEINKDYYKIALDRLK